MTWMSMRGFLEVCSRLLARRGRHPLVYRVRGSVALSTSVKDRSLTDGSTGLDYLMGDDESEVVREEDTSLKPDIRRKMESFLPPSSHESASLLYDPLASKFINMIMRDGKKSQAQRIFMKSLEYVKRTQIVRATTGGEESVVVNPIKIFHHAIENVKPTVSTYSMRRGGRSYSIPCSIPENRRVFLACKWIIESSKQKNGLSFAKQLAINFIDSYNHRGAAVKKKQDIHRLADANRAFAHFRW